jgi:hypothetical protein
MRKSGTNEDDVRMSDVVCDFCHGEWTETVPMIEGHHGSCLCGKCLSVAYLELVVNGQSNAPPDFTCPMCLEGEADRASLDRQDEPGWCSPVVEDAVLCQRCLEMAAKALDKDPDYAWSKPG